MRPPARFQGTHALRAPCLLCRRRMGQFFQAAHNVAQLIPVIEPRRYEIRFDHGQFDQKCWRKQSRAAIGINIVTTPIRCLLWPDSIIR
jgi:hypothetical protein